MADRELAVMEQELGLLRRDFGAFDQRLMRLEAQLGELLVAPAHAAAEAQVVAQPVSVPTLTAAPSVAPPTPPPAAAPVAAVEERPARHPSERRKPGLFDLGTAEPVGPRPAPQARPSWTASHIPSLAKRPLDIEELVGGHLLAWVGGLAILLGAIFFLSLAFSRGWITPSMRVVMGVAGGAVLIGAGAFFFNRREALFGHVLVAVGLGVLSIALFAGTRLYDLIRVDIALGGVLIAALAAAVIAIRFNTQAVAAYGLIAALAAPPLLGASPSGTTIAYAVAILAGTTTIALYRSWHWLPPIAFVLSAPQLIDWMSREKSVAVALTALAGYWLLNAVAAGGEEFRVRRRVLSITSTTLLVANAGLLVWLGFDVLDGDLTGWRGAFLLAVAAAHFALGGYFLREEGDHHPFGMLAFGTGIAALSMAVPVQLGGPYVPIAWAAEATALAWVCGDRRHGYSGLVALALGALAIGHLATFEYPFWHIVDGRPSAYAFVNSAAGTLGFMLAALAVAGYFLPRRAMRARLANVGLLLVAYALPFELSGLWLLAAWSTLCLLALGFAYRLLPLTGEDSSWTFALPERGLRQWLSRTPLLPETLLLPPVAGAVAGLLAVAHAGRYDLPWREMRHALPGVPFTDHFTVAALILIAAAVLGGIVVGTAWSHRAGYILGIAVAAYLMPFELSDAAVVVAWAALSVGVALLTLLDRDGEKAYLATSTALLGVGVLTILATVAPPGRLFVRSGVQIDHPPLWSGATAALGTVAAVLAAGYGIYRTSRWRPILGALAGVLVIYLLSVALVDDFQRRVGGATELEELQKQAQTGLSVLWAAIGGGVLAAGLLRRAAPTRIFGLALLVLTTVKVFVYDMASLDTSYRVLSLIALGVLLLLSAYAYQHFMPRPPSEGGGEGLHGWFRGGGRGKGPAAG